MLSLSIHINKEPFHIFGFSLSYVSFLHKIFHCYVFKIWSCLMAFAFTVQVFRMMSDASEMLAAALEQMDGIIAGIL